MVAPRPKFYSFPLGPEAHLGAQRHLGPKDHLGAQRHLGPKAHFKRPEAATSAKARSRQLFEGDNAKSGLAEGALGVDGADNERVLLRIVGAGGDVAR